MLKAAFINYFKFFKYIFAVMGAVYLGILISFLFFGGGFLRIFGRDIEDYVSVYEYMTGVLSGAKIGQILNRRFLGELVSETGDLLGHTRDSGRGVAAYASVSAAVIIIACQFSIYLCRSFIKKDVAGNETRRGIIVFIIRCAATAVFTAALIILGYLWIYSAVIMISLNLLIAALANLMYARYIYYPGVPLKRFLRPKVIGLAFLAEILTLLMTGVFVAAAWLIFNSFVAVILAIPLIMYGAAVTEFTAVEYFRLKTA